MISFDVNNINSILKFFIKICKNDQLNQGSIKLSLDNKKVIRFKLSQISKTKQKNLVMVLDDISEVGLELLKKRTAIDLEFVLEDTVIKTHGMIFKVTDKVVIVYLPNKLKVVKNRTDKRFKIPEGMSAFFIPENYEVDPLDVSAPTVFPLYEDMSKWIKIIDISKGGFSIECRFPHFIKWIEKERFVQIGTLIYPGQDPVFFSAELVWSKRFKEKNKTESVFSEQKYRCGFKWDVFEESDQERIQNILQYLSTFQSEDGNTAILVELQKGAL